MIKVERNIPVGSQMGGDQRPSQLHLPPKAIMGTRLTAKFGKIIITWGTTTLHDGGEFKAKEFLLRRLKDEKKRRTWLKSELRRKQKDVAWLENALSEQSVDLPQMEKETKAYREVKHG